MQEQRADYEIESIDKIKYMEEMHQNNIQNLETGFQAQIMQMVDDYQQLVRDRDAQIERLDEQRKKLVLSHERYVEELTTDFEIKLNNDKNLHHKLADEKDNLEKELIEVLLLFIIMLILFAFVIIIVIIIILILDSKSTRR